MLDALDEDCPGGELQQVSLPHVHELKAQLAEESVHELEYLLLDEVDFVEIPLEVFGMQHGRGVLGLLVLIPLLALLVLQLVHQVLGFLGDGLHRLLQILYHVGGVRLAVLDAALKAEDHAACEAHRVGLLLTAALAQIIHWGLNVGSEH